jgi:hypothetical protein
MTKIKVVISNRYGYPSGYITKVDFPDFPSMVNGKPVYSYKIDREAIIIKINLADRVGRNTATTNSIRESDGYFDNMDMAVRCFMRGLLS